MKAIGRGKYIATVLVLAYPNVTIAIIGVGLLLTSFVNYLLLALLTLQILAIVFSAVLIFRAVVIRKQSRSRRPLGDVHPTWIRLTNLCALFSVLDLLIMILFFRLSNYSQYTQTVALYLMTLFLPIAFLGSFMFRETFLPLVDEDFSYSLNSPNTKVWVSASLAKVLLKAHKERGIMYLGNALEGTRTVFEKADGYSDPLDHAVALVHFIWDAGIHADYDRLAAFAAAIFSGEHPKLENIPAGTKHLVDSFGWFAETKPIESGRPGATSQFVDRLSKYAGELLGGAGIVGALAIFIQSLGQSISAVGTALQNDIPAIAVIVTAFLVLYLPGAASSPRGT